MYEILDENGQVINKIIANEQFVQENYPGRYRYVDDSTVVQYPSIITRLAFRYRMTDEEYVGILNAAKTDVSVAAWVETFNIVTQVNLKDPRTNSGLTMMVNKGLLTPERKTEILNAPVTESEVIPNPFAPSQL